jgi:hypothetical protein
MQMLHYWANFAKTGSFELFLASNVMKEIPMVQLKPMSRGLLTLLLHPKLSTLKAQLQSKQIFAKSMWIFGEVTSLMESLL